jgi:hypothetical protein
MATVDAAFSKRCLMTRHRWRRRWHRRSGGTTRKSDPARSHSPFGTLVSHGQLRSHLPHPKRSDQLDRYACAAGPNLQSGRSTPTRLRCFLDAKEEARNWRICPIRPIHGPESMPHTQNEAHESSRDAVQMLKEFSLGVFGVDRPVALLGPSWPPCCPPSCPAIHAVSSQFMPNICPTCNGSPAVKQDRCSSNY